MNESRLATFQRIVRLHPDRAAAGLNQLQMSCKQLFATSQGLRRQMDAAALCPTGITGGAPEGPQICRIAPLLAKAVMTKGMPAQVAAWDVTIQGHFSKAIVMHPPVMLTLRLPTGAAGTLSVGIAMHPDVWNNPASGGCEFGIRVAGRINFAMALDPLHIESDRRWHEIQLAVPANSSGPHEVTFEVRCAGSPDFRWALWREPRFCWMSDAAACSGAPPARAEEPVALISS